MKTEPKTIVLGLIGGVCGSLFFSVTLQTVGISSADTKGSTSQPVTEIKGPVTIKVPAGAAALTVEGKMVIKGDLDVQGTVTGTVPACACTAKVEVPSLIGLSLEAAKSKLGQLGLGVTTACLKDSTLTEAKSSGASKKSPAGSGALVSDKESLEKTATTYVVSQTPSAGTPVNAGTMVNLSYLKASCP